MTIALIAAMDKNRVIGYQNKLPWHLPADLKHFKELTLGKPILMGRKTFESIGKPLPNRQNIVLTNDTEFSAPGCQVIHDLEAVLELPELMVIGGAHLFLQLLPNASLLYLTFIDYDFKGDVFFPEFNKDEWQKVAEESHLADEKNPYAYKFITYERI